MRAVLILALVTAVATASPKVPTVIDCYKLVGKAHPLNKTAAGWVVDGKISATVDLANGYLTFTDPATKDVTTVVVWAGDRHRYFFGVTGSGGVMNYFEYDGDATEDFQDTPLPPLAITDLLMPGADAKLVDANADVFSRTLDLRIELPRKGTTLVGFVDLARMRDAVKDAKLAEPIRTKLLAIVDTQVYTRVEMTFRKDNGHFDLGKRTKPK